jgi:bacterioferritin
MASKKLLDMMNKGISMELQVSIQYLWQHVQWSGVKGFTFHDELKKTAITEMKHAEKIAERLFYLGEKPTTQPAKIVIGESLKDMVDLDRKAEEGAIKLYKEIIKLAETEGDVTTAHIFRKILEEEEEHHDTFTTLLEEV